MSEWAERFGGAALVTGASSGIGEAFSWALARRGLDVVLVARRRALLMALAERLEAECGIQALVVDADLTDSNSPGRILSEVQSAGLEIGLLVNNAGAGAFGPFAECDPKQLEALVDLNCRSPQALTGACLPGMLRRERGGVIFVSSMAATQPVPYLASYAASKAFVLSLAQALWAELGPRGIAVVGVAPGFVDTGFQSEAGLDRRMGFGTERSAEEVVEAALAGLGRTHTVVPGTANGVMSWLARVTPRTAVLRSGARLLKPEGERNVTTGEAVRPPAGESADFRLRLARMVLAFLLVGAIDLTVGSLLVNRLRFWFPQWLDAGWADRSDPWVVYSQSYIAGILFVPFVAVALWQECVAPLRSRWVRRLFWPVAGALAVFLVIWKGGLMREYAKEREALAWIVLTAIVYGGLTVAGGLPDRARRWNNRGLVGAVAAGVGGFFLVMAVLDPLLQIGWQGLRWTGGLSVEIAFFVPAGLALGVLARHLRRREPI